MRVLIARNNCWKWVDHKDWLYWDNEHLKMVNNSTCDYYLIFYRTDGKDCTSLPRVTSNWTVEFKNDRTFNFSIEF